MGEWLGEWSSHRKVPQKKRQNPRRRPVKPGVRVAEPMGGYMYTNSLRCLVFASESARIRGAAHANCQCRPPWCAPEALACASLVVEPHAASEWRGRTVRGQARVRRGFAAPRQRASGAAAMDLPPRRAHARRRHCRGVSTPPSRPSRSHRRAPDARRGRTGATLPRLHEVQLSRGQVLGRRSCARARSL